MGGVAVGVAGVVLGGVEGVGGAGGAVGEVGAGGAVFGAGLAAAGCGVLVHLVRACCAAFSC